MASETTEPMTPRRRWIALVVLCVGQLMIILDSTVVNVALPAIQRDLHFSQSSLAWVVNAYLLTFGGLLLLAGRLGDLLGRVRLFLIGLAAFAVASALCGLAPTATVLVLARFLQGMSAAMVASMVLGIISPMFPEPAERTRALSVFAFVAMGGATLGLVLGGAITQWINWHWIFFINVPLAVVALALGRRLLVPMPGIGLDKGADVVGAVLVTASPMLAVFGLINADSDGWSSFATIGPLIGALAVAGLFVAVEARIRTPLIPLSIFRHRNLVSATIVRTLFPMGGWGMSFLGALYLQHVLGYGPLGTGLAFLPSTAMTGVFSVVLIPRLVRRFSLKSLMLTGLVFVVTGLLLFARAPAYGSFVPDVLPTMLLTGTGFGLLFMPGVAISLSDVEEHESGIASGMVNVSVQLGASIGIALLATVSSSRTAALLASHHGARQALAAGYGRGLLVGAICATISLVVAAVLLVSHPPGQAHSTATAPVLLEEPGIA